MKNARVVRLFDVSAGEAEPLGAGLPKVREAAAPDWLRRETGPVAPVFVRPAPAPAPVVPEPAPEPAAATAPTDDQITEVLAEAEAEGLRRAHERVDALTARYVDGLRRLLEAARAAGRPDPSEVVDLALLVAREILGREATADRGALVDVLESALRGARAEAPVTLRLGLVEIGHLSRLHPELLDGVTVIPDATLGPGGFVVETRARVIDASIAARLAAVREALLALWHEPEAVLALP